MSSGKSARNNRRGVLGRYVTHYADRKLRPEKSRAKPLTNVLDTRGSLREVIYLVAERLRFVSAAHRPRNV